MKMPAISFPQADRPDNAVYTQWEQEAKESAVDRRKKKKEKKKERNAHS